MAKPAFTEQPPEPNAVQAVSGSSDSGIAQAATHDGSGEQSGSDDVDASGSDWPAGDAYENLHTEVTQLRRAMQTRPPIDKSMGVLMAVYSLSEDEAWQILVSASQHTNTKLYAVAEQIVGSTQDGIVDPQVRRTIEAALKDLKAR